MVSLVVGGYESVTLASTWALYLLAKFPNVLDKLREENMAASKNKKGDFITSEDISKMKYTNKVVEETIRMANVALISFRLVTREVEYKGTKLQLVFTYEESFEWELINPEAEIIYLPHQKPVDGVEIKFSKI
ncbi:hypothetical protein ACOSP7_024372 [Xanthoceras sorbifolium]